MFQFRNRLRSSDQSAYSPIGESVSFEVAVVQAATLLDDAALQAKRNKDVEAMIGVVNAWLELADALVQDTEAEDEEDFDIELESDIAESFSIIGISSPEDRDRKESAYYGRKDSQDWHGPQSKLGKL